MNPEDATPTPPLDELRAAILLALAEAPGEAGMSLPRLGKRLGLGVSVLMRALSGMGDARIGHVAGPGWVRVTQVDDRWTAALTQAGRAFCASWRADQAPEAGGHAP